MCKGLSETEARASHAVFAGSARRAPISTRSFLGRVVGGWAVENHVPYAGK